MDFRSFERSIDRHPRLVMVGLGLGLIATYKYVEPDLKTEDVTVTLGVTCDGGYDDLSIELLDTPTSAGQDSDLLFDVSCDSGPVYVYPDSSSIWGDEGIDTANRDMAAYIEVRAEDTYGTDEEVYASRYNVNINSMEQWTGSVRIENIDNVNEMFLIDPIGSIIEKIET